MKIAARQLTHLIREAYAMTPRIIDASHRNVISRGYRWHREFDTFIEAWRNTFPHTLDYVTSMHDDKIVMHLIDTPPESALARFIRRYESNHYFQIVDWELAVEASVDDAASYAAGGPVIILQMR